MNFKSVVVPCDYGSCGICVGPWPFVSTSQISFELEEINQSWQHQITKQQTVYTTKFRFVLVTNLWPWSNLVDCTALLFQSYDTQETDAEQIPRSDILGLFVSFETGLICGIAA